MSSVVTRRRPSRGRERPRTRPVTGERTCVGTEAPTLWEERDGMEAVGGEATLDELVCGVWEGLAAHRSVACPLCGGEMAPVYGAHAAASHGRCGSCGTMLG